MDIIIEKNSNKIPFKRCLHHKGNDLLLLNIQNQSDQYEICNKCLQFNKYPIQQIVGITDIIYAEENSFITNFPPLEDEQIHDLISQQLYSEENQINSKIIDIRNYFDILKNSFHQALKQVQIKSEEKIVSLLQLKQNIIDTYNQISSKNELQRIYQENSGYNNQQIHKIICEKFENIKLNTKKMQQSIKQFNLVYQNISLSQPTQIKDNILQLIEKIDFFSNLEVDKYSNLLSQEKQEENLNDNQNVKSNTEILLQLIENKTNYCSSEFKDQFKQIINKLDFLFNQTKINCQIYDQQKRESFTDLNDQQLENLRVLAQKIQIIDQEHEIINVNNISDNIQLNSYFGISQNQLEQLQQKYPIFESDIQNHPILFKSINFIKSQLSGSQNQQITKNNMCLCISKILQDGHAISYSNIIFNPEKKYIIRLQIQTYKTNTFVLFGLIPDNNKDTSFLYSTGLSYNERGDYNTFNKIKKGNAIPSGQIQNINKEIEIRIHLKDKFIRIASYPSYANVSELNNTNSIQENIEYRFATELFQQNDNITITDFFTVENFNDKM